jgi:hypothetical protein
MPPEPPVTRTVRPTIAPAPSCAIGSTSSQVRVRPVRAADPARRREQRPRWYRTI